MNNKRLEASILIEKMVKSNPNLTYVDACLIYAEENDVDIEKMPKFISASLKAKLHNESMENKLIKTGSKPASLNEFIK
jgi:hypothetical protein